MCQPGRPGTGNARRRRPGRLARLGRFPQHEVGTVPLVGRDIDAGAGDHLVQRAVGERAIARQHRVRRVHRLRREQHVVFGDIGKASLHQPLDDLAHFSDVLGRARLHRRPQRPQRIDIVVELLFGQLGDLADRLVQRQLGEIPRRTRVDLVVDVGDVADIGDVLVAVEMPQQPEQHVEQDDRTCVADMGEVIDRRPADIHAHVGGIERRERPLLLRQRIVES